MSDLELGLPTKLHKEYSIDRPQSLSFGDIEKRLEEADLCWLIDLEDSE